MKYSEHTEGCQGSDGHRRTIPERIGTEGVAAVKGAPFAAWGQDREKEYR